MKKTAKIVISLLLCISVLISLVSCRYVNNALQYIKAHFTDNKEQNEHSRSCSCYPNPPKGYTGGFHLMPGDRNTIEIHWVETYEEAIKALEHLEAAGNPIKKAVLSSYENDDVDAKYAFLLNLRECKHLEEGKAWYDREQCWGVKVFYFGFLEKVSIEKLEYSNYLRYKHVRLGPVGETQFTDTDDISYACIQCGVVENDSWKNIMEMSEQEMCYIVRNYTLSPEIVTYMMYNEIENHTDIFPENFHDDFIKTLVCVGNKENTY